MKTKCFSLREKILLDIKEELTSPKACLAPGSRLLLVLMCWLLAKLKAAVVVVVAGVADDAG